MEISAGHIRLRIDPERGGAPDGIWFDHDGDGAFSDDELILDTGPGQGLVLEVLEMPRTRSTVPSSEWVAGRTPGPRESWYAGESYRLAAITDSVEQSGPAKLTVLGRFFWAGIWPYRLDWEVTEGGAVLGQLQLLDGGRQEPRPSEVLALGLDLRLHYRSREAFRRRAVHAAVDRRIWELPAEVVRWWRGIEGYTARPERYGFSRNVEVPWPDFNLVALAQNGVDDCELWKAVARDTGHLTHWRGAKSRGWIHVEDRQWGVGYGIRELAANAPGSLSTHLDTGDLTASIHLGFWPSQAHRLNPAGPDGEKLMRPHSFFLVPNAGRWSDEMAVGLDALGVPSGVSDVEPKAERVMFTKPKDLPPTTERGGGAVFRIDEPAGVDRKAWPVSVGVPLRQGEVMPADGLVLTGPNGQPIPCQTETLAYWPDGSVKWVLVDAQVDLPKGTGSTFSLTKGAASPEPATKIVAAETLTGVRIETGPLAFEIDRNGSGFVDRVWLDTNGDGRFDADEVVVGDGGGRRSILDFVRTDSYVTGDHDIRGTLDESEVRIDELKIERSGPLRAVVLIRGAYRNRVESPFTLRLEAYAGKPWIRAQHTFTYTMDPQGEFVKAIGLSLPVAMEGAQFTVSGSAGPASLHASQGGILQESLRKAFVWQRDADGVITESDAHERSRGWADISGGGWGLTIAVQDFWQEFPKAVTADGSAITAWFWPPEAPPLDLRRYSRWMFPQVGETINPFPFRGDARNVGYATGLAKTSTAVFAFHVGPLVAEDAETLAKGFQDRPLAVCSPDYYAEVAVTGRFAAYDESFPETERTLTDICDLFIFNRERFSWYGMIDHGDIGHTWRPPIRYDDDGPFIPRDGWAYDIGRWGWTNTEGQDALGYLMCFFHTGHRPYFDAGAITARHNQDVDIFQWGPYKYYGHTRHNVNHWGDGDFEIRISQPSPNRFSYYLTGDLRSRDIMEGVVDELYLSLTVTQSADLGAVLYGFMVRWEMTGDPVWRDRALGICHAYADYQSPSGYLAHRNLSIEAATGRRLRDAAVDEDDGHDLMFLHGFGAIHAMVELEQLTGDERLWDMLYKHAVHCAGIDPRVSAYFLVLAHALDRTGERRFADRLLANLARRGFMRGIYPRDRKYWTGAWDPSDPEAAKVVRSVNTSGAGFDWSPMPVVLHALRKHGFDEDDVPK